jgi:hypothetical protein
MGTLFTHKDGTEVAQRSFGGETVGVRIELRRGAADVSHNTMLYGSDGSRETLESLALSVGNGRHRDWIQKLAKRADASFAVNAKEPKSMASAIGQVPVTIVQRPETAGIEDALNRIADMISQLVAQGDERS